MLVADRVTDLEKLALECQQAPFKNVWIIN